MPLIYKILKESKDALFFMKGVSKNSVLLSLSKRYT